MREGAQSHATARSAQRIEQWQSQTQTQDAELHNAVVAGRAWGLERQQTRERGAGVERPGTVKQVGKVLYAQVG